MVERVHIASNCKQQKVNNYSNKATPIRILKLIKIKQGTTSNMNETFVLSGIDSTLCYISCLQRRHMQTVYSSHDGGSDKQTVQYRQHFRKF